MNEAWWPWLYQYGVGGSVFAASMVLAVKTGAISLDRPRDKRIALLLGVCVLIAFTVHGLWIAAVIG
ncbi:MAG: hypothetical protein R3C68_02920 [Myxococcota bacterium]